MAPSLPPLVDGRIVPTRSTMATLVQGRDREDRMAGSLGRSRGHRAPRGRDARPDRRPGARKGPRRVGKSSWPRLDAAQVRVCRPPLCRRPPLDLRLPQGAQARWRLHLDGRERRDRRYRLAEIAAALREVHEGRNMGKIVVTMW